VARQDPMLKIMNTGVFTTIKVTKGIPLFFEQHKKRLLANAKALHLPKVSLSINDVKQYLTNNNLTSCALKITLVKEKNKTVVAIEQRPLPSSDSSIKLVTVKDTRDIFKVLKTTDRSINNHAKIFAKKNDAQDAVFVNNKTLIESTISNIFSINKKGDIITPPIEGKGLKGIARGIIKKNIKILEGEIPENTTQPIVLTNSLRIQKVTHLNGRKLKNADKLFQQIKNILEKAELNYLSNSWVARLEGLPSARTPRSAGALTGRKPGQDPRKQIFYKNFKTWNNPQEIFVKLFSDEPSAFWLDSSLTSESSRFSYMGIPEEIISYSLKQNIITIKKDNKTQKIKQNIFDFLEDKLKKQNVKSANLPFDFIGGYVGYFGYELKKLTGSKTAFQSPYPDSLWFYTEKTIVFDHKEKKVYLACLTENKQEANEWFDKTEKEYLIKRGVTAVEGLPTARSEMTIEGARREGTAVRTPRDKKIEFKLNRDHKQYLKDIKICKKHLQLGESYQICLTNQITAKGKVDPLELYLKLRKTNPAPYAAFIKYNDLAILSSSPEEFLKIDDRDIETKPIKGTIRRGEYPEEDKVLIKQLSESKKDWSENAMIVDLLRNDLGKISEFGSVKVAKLMHVESYQTVHQLVSTVTGKLRKDKSIIDTVKAAFPGGSMTGAPKIHTMEIIDSLEKKARGIYSGSI
jgi:anthranilate/para-aminobenzoate synthase component I/branched-subunit amino acid aminotransferase/4-amino-4-deoxychorismate lyase